MFRVVKCQEAGSNASRKHRARLAGRILGHRLGLTGLTGLALFAAASAADGATAKSCPPGASGFITLGTMGGPVPDGRRSQPANVLVNAGAIYLVDAGDGTAEQLAKVGYQVSAVKAVFLSHLHGDHTAGLYAVLALRNQTEVREKLAIYGPPGTKDFVAGLVAAMQPAAKAGYGTPGQSWGAPEASVNVVEMDGTADFALGSLRVRTVQNSHYDFLPGGPEDRAYKSLSLRFDMPDRSIVYTGDTGPSPAVQRLATGADLLVSEMIDLEATLARVARVSPNMPETVKQEMVKHLATHHLTPQDVGKLAAGAAVRFLAITHIAGGIDGPEREAAILSQVKQPYHGPVTLAADLDCF